MRWQAIASMENFFQAHRPPKVTFQEGKSISIGAYRMICFMYWWVISCWPFIGPLVPLEQVDVLRGHQVFFQGQDLPPVIWPRFGIKTPCSAVTELINRAIVLYIEIRGATTDSKELTINADNTNFCGRNLYEDMYWISFSCIIYNPSVLFMF